MKYIVVMILVLRAGAAAVGPHDDVLACVAHLETIFSLNTSQIETVIGNDLGDGPRPAELRRAYNRHGRALINPTYRSDGLRRSRQLTLGIDAMAPDYFEDLVHLVRRDLGDRLLRARLTPVSNGDDAPRSDPVKAYRASTGFRHPLTAPEAAQLFLVLDSILMRRVPSQERDTIKFGVARNSARTF